MIIFLHQEIAEKYLELCITVSIACSAHSGLCCSQKSLTLCWTRQELMQHVITAGKKVSEKMMGKK